MTEQEPDPRTLLPLKPLHFDILVILAEGERHGWGIAKALEGRARARRTILPGNLYRTLRSMLSKGIIAESTDRPSPDEDDERRRYYRITDFGVRVARAEARRLEGSLADARATDLLGAIPEDGLT